MREPSSALIVTAGSHLCAFALRRVREVMRPQPVQPLSTSFPFMEGVAMIRGEPTPVLNLARLLGDAQPPPPERLVTVDVGPRSVAMAVGSVRAIRALDLESVRDLPPLLRDSDSEQIERLALLDTEFVAMLSEAKLVPEALWRELDRAGAVA